MPLWTRQHFGDREGREQLTKAFGELASFDIEQIRAAMVQATEPWRAYKKSGVGEGKGAGGEAGKQAAREAFASFERGINLLLFNDYYFDVPQNRWWALAVGSDGKLFVAYTFRGLGASLPDAVEQFDRYRREYGVRLRPGWIEKKLSDKK